MDDPQLGARIRRRDSEALRAVVHTYLPQLLRAALGAGLELQRAREVTQDTFLTFIEKAAQFEGRSHVRTWLFGILYRKIAEARRQLQRERQMDDIEEIVEQRFDPKGSWVRPPQPVDMKLYSSEVGGFLEGCLGAVPTQQKMAFVLREVEEFASEEICKILGVTRTNLGVLMLPCPQPSSGVPGGKRSEEIAAMLRCKEVARKIASDEFAEAGWRDRMAVRLHLAMCRHCRRYAVQLRAIGAAARNIWSHRSQDLATVEQLEREISERSFGRSGDSTEIHSGPEE